MAIPPPPSITGGAAGPSGARENGGTGNIGGQTVGDYYAAGSRRTTDEGWGWQELAVMGVVALVGVYLWQR